MAVFPKTAIRDYYDFTPPFENGTGDIYAFEQATNQRLPPPVVP